jgi:hypothetical protein
MDEPIWNNLENTTKTCTNDIETGHQRVPGQYGTQTVQVPGT